MWVGRGLGGVLFKGPTGAKGDPGSSVGGTGTTEELASWQTQGWGLLVLGVEVRGSG